MCCSLDTFIIHYAEEATTQPIHFPFRTNTLLEEELLDALVELGGLGGLSLDLAELLLGEGSGVGVLAKHDLLVAERVLLLDVAALGLGLALGGAEDALDFRRVDEAGKVGLGDNVGGKEEALLALVDGVELLDGSRGPDDETAEVTTRGELEEVEGIDGGGLNTGDVAEALDEVLAVGLGGVDDERTTALAVATAPHLTLTSTELLGLLNLLDVGASANSLEEGNGSSGLSSAGESGGVDNEGNLGDGSDLVAAGHQEGSDGGGSQSRGGSETPVSSLLDGCRLQIFDIWDKLTSGPG